MRESFVIHTDYIEDLPSEVQDKWLRYVYDYGAKGKEPENISDFEKVVWLKIKARIDKEVVAYEWAKIQNRIKQIRNRIKNGKASERDITICNRYEELNPVTPYTPGDIVYVYEYVFDYVYDNIYDIGVTVTKPSITTCNRYKKQNPPTEKIEKPKSLTSELVSDALETPEQPLQKAFAETIYNTFKAAGLPVDESFLQFYMSDDFKQALSVLMKKTTNQESILQACKNYTSVYNKQGYYVPFRYTFLSFVKSTHFIEYLPSNFKPENFIDKRNLQGREAVYFDDHNPSGGFIKPDNCNW